MIALILLHTIGVFYFQKIKMADYKSTTNSINGKNFDFKYLAIHSLLYVIPFLLLAFVIEWYWYLLILGIFFATSWIVDLFSCWLKRYIKKTMVFLLGQAIHILVLFFVYKTFHFNSGILVDYEKTIYQSTIVLFLLKPSSIIVNHIFDDAFGSDNPKDDGTFDVGAIIGIFERIIIVILSTFNAITAVAIIITVKTWARSNDIKTKEGFGNKYLVGTLVSISLALIASYCWHIIK